MFWGIILLVIVRLSCSRHFSPTLFYSGALCGSKTTFRNRFLGKGLVKTRQNSVTKYFKIEFSARLVRPVAIPGLRRQPNRSLSIKADVLLPTTIEIRQSPGVLQEDLGNATAVSGGSQAQLSSRHWADGRPQPTAEQPLGVIRPVNTFSTLERIL